MVPFTIKERILEKSYALNDKKNGGSLQCNSPSVWVPSGSGKNMFLKKIVKDLLRDHSFMIICLMAGIQVVILSDDPRVRRST